MPRSLVIEMQKQGYTFALAHIESNALRGLFIGSPIRLPAGAVFMPMWVKESEDQVTAILGSEPPLDTPPVNIPRSSFLSLTKMPTEAP